MAKTHSDIDWEYMAECVAQRRYLSKCNTLSYSALKDIAEEEFISYMQNDADSLRECRKRIFAEYRKMERMERNFSKY